ncbi:MAG TPA: histidine kinase [Ignavibacteriales bacterium]|nr:histidine kinase [Ignavibacteriales bacterium]
MIPDDEKHIRRTVLRQVLIYLTILIIFNAGVSVTDDLANGLSISVLMVFIREATGVYLFFPFIVLALYFFEKYPVVKGKVFQRLLIHFLVSVSFGITHTTLMYYTRKYLWPVLGYRQFDYGILLYRYLMEYFKQALVYSLAYMLYRWVKNLWEARQQELRTIQLQEQLTKARLEALQMQLNPHFLFNTLNLISSKMYDDVSVADRLISKLSELLRITLSSATRNIHSLEEELNVLRLYFNIMQERFSEKLKVEINISEDTLSCRVPNLILQPLVENSMKYSMENLKESIVKVSSLRADGSLVLTVEDNGRGIDQNPGQLNRGIGLSNTVERLENIYGNRYDFHLENLPSGGLKARITIPYETDKL